ncbi:hypothetical protein LQZ39_19350 [Enterobacter cloacae complex sp. RIVM_C039474]|uniref:hypothetical protein n=1 Tax=Enterobacter cloacae complex sp. RIVM_C039474 TaxID=2900327 RepID=UPI00233FA766|nr:hypothetical protein [Enterobacter cloacae complex sp. RIVM_C039474]MDC4196686.1 hypothetical protein [Enterobacter cloacae complex sp. RIVM_C039474]
MSTITKERLLKIKQWRETYGYGSNVVLPAAEAEELARMALAGMEAEPVAYSLIFRNMDGVLNDYVNANTTFSTIEKAQAYGRGGNYVRQNDGSLQWVSDPSLDPVVVPLYTAPPAPVSVPDERYQHLSELYHAQEKRLFKLAQRIKGPSFDKYAYSPSQAIDVLESAIFGERKDEDCRAAMLQGADGNSPVIPDCSCGTCRPVTFTDSRFVVCSECGNKRCPHAIDHRNACTGSNEPGQEGSAYPAAPQQEVK